MLSRRTVLILGGAALVAAGAGYSLRDPAFAGPALDAPTAYRQVAAGEILLVDIRRPDEWEATGSALGAHRIDMRRPDFIEALAALAEGDKSRPIALICARGVRSGRLAKDMTESGFSAIIDIPEGMLGSTAGPGWLARGLPLATD